MALCSVLANGVSHRSIGKSRIFQAAPIEINFRTSEIGTYTVQEIGVDASTYRGIEITRFIAQNDSNQSES